MAYRLLKRIVGSKLTNLDPKAKDYICPVCGYKSKEKVMCPSCGAKMSKKKTPDEALNRLSIINLEHRKLIRKFVRENVELSERDELQSVSQIGAELAGGARKVKSVAGRVKHHFSPGERLARGQKRRGRKLFKLTHKEKKSQMKADISGIKSKRYSILKKKYEQYQIDPERMKQYTTRQHTLDYLKNRRRQIKKDYRVAKLQRKADYAG